MIDTCECRNFAMLTKRLTTRTIPKASRSREQQKSQASYNSSQQLLNISTSLSHHIAKIRYFKTETDVLPYSANVTIYSDYLPIKTYKR